MKRKLASDSMTLTGQTVGPRPDLEQAERLKAILRTRADDQFELDLLFSGNPKIRHQTRQKIERLLVQAEAAETMAPGLQRDMSKMASVTDEEAKILGMEKRSMSGGWAKAMLSNAEKSGVVAKNGLSGPARLRRLMDKSVAGETAVFGKKKLTAGAQNRMNYARQDVSSSANHMLDELGKNRVKTASIAPNVDAWFEKNAAVLKKAAIPTPALGAKALRVTSSPRAGRLSAQSNLSGGSA